MHLALTMDRPTCRICGEVSEEDAPLYHPCRCAGTIKYVHEICLVKWLTIKQTGRSGEPQVIADLTQSKCELCGFDFRFTPIYSADYNSERRFWNASVAIEIVKSLSRRTSESFIYILLTLLWTILAPVMVGTAVVRMALYWNELPLSSGSYVVSYIMGMFSLVIGIVVLVISTRVRDIPQLPRDIRSTGIIIGLAALCGTTITIVPYLTGRSFRKLVSNMCQHNEIFCTLVQNEPDNLSPISQHLSNISLGLLLLVAGGIVGILIRRLYRAGISSLLSTLSSFMVNFVRTFAYLIVPVSVGYFTTQTILSADSRISLSSKLTPFGSLVIHLVIGATLILPLVLLERFTYSHFVSRRLREQITNSRVSHVIFNGRTYRNFSTRIDCVCRESLIRIFIHLFFLYCSILPAKTILQFFHLLPFQSENPPASTSSSLLLPMELFYAHILVPLALNVPQFPRWIKRKFDFFCRKIRYADFQQPPLTFKLVIVWLLIRLSSILILTIVFVGVPTIVARLTFGTDDMVSISVAALIVAGLINISIRILSAYEVPRHNVEPNRPRTESEVGTEVDVNVSSFPYQIKRHFFRGIKIISTTLFVVVLLPIFVGIAFHSVIVAPIRHFVADLHLRDHEPLQDHDNQRTWWTLIAPIWIVGLMLLKILIALVSVGNNNAILFGSLRMRVEAITRAYETHGPFSNQLISAVAHASWTITKPIIFHVFIPEFFGILAMKLNLVSPEFRVFVVDIYLFSRLTISVIAPAVWSIILAEHRAILNRKFLIKTELRNFFLDDSSISEEGVPSAPLPSIQVNVVNT